MTAPVIQFKRGALVNLPGLQAGEPGFTTDSYDFYIGLTSETSTNKFFGSNRYWSKETSSSGSGLNLVEGTSNGSGYITLKSPDSLSGVGTYTLPDTSTITDGYFLKVNSSGTLSWDTVGGTNGNFASPTLSGLTTINDNFDVNASSDFSGITTFSNSTNNTLGDENTGAIQIDGGVGIAKNLTVKENLYVGGHSEFVGVVTFKGGTINLGDGNTDNINIGGEFVSNLTPNDDDAYDIGTGSKRWRNANFSGVSTFNNVTVGGASTALLVQGNTRIIGILTVGSASVTLSGVNNLIAGVTTFTGFVDLNEGVNVDGHTELDNLNVTGVATFSQTIIGNASSADQVKTVTASNTDATYHITFVDANNGSATNESVYTDDGIYYNPGTNTFTTQHGHFTGDLIVGTALSAPTVKTATVQHSNGTQAATIDTSGNITASQNLTVSGNLYVNGSTTQVNTASITVEDRTIELGQVDGAAPSSATTWDLGVLFNYNASGAKKSGVIWEHADGRFKFGSQVSDGGGTNNDSPQITVSNYASIEIGSLWINDCAGQSEVISCSNGLRTLQNITIDCGTF